jgi:hypothetical protein
MPRSTDRRGELLASALDDGVGDSADEQLRRELAMVGLLVRAGEVARPDAAARDRMRRRIMADLAAEEFVPEPVVTPVVTRATPVVSLEAARRGRTRSAGLQGRLLVAAAASLCLLLSLSAMSLVLARDALPGDALYRVKRSAESAELGLTFGDEPRGFKHLQFATARVDEIEALAAGGGGSAGSFLTALQAFDTDAAAGSRLLVETATNGDGDELDALRDWAQQQQVRLEAARDSMPERASSRAGGSLDLLTRVADRASALEPRLNCLAVTSGARDEVGLLPATGPCEPAPGVGPLPSGVPSTADRARPAVPPGLVIPNRPGDEDPTGPIGPLDPQPTGPPSSDEPGAPPGGSDPDQPPTTTPQQSITIPLPLPILPEITVPPLLGLLPGLKLG